MGLRYDVSGTGEPLLLLHGALMSRRMWQVQRATFGRHFKVITPDLPAHGETPDIAGPYTITSLTQRVLDLLDTLDLPQVHVCGHSLGGMVAQHLTVAHPTRVRNLVLAETAFGTQNTPVERLQTRLARLVLKFTPVRTLANMSVQRYGAQRRDVAVFIRQEMSRYDRATIVRIMGAALEFVGKAQLPHITAPTVVLVAANNPQTHTQGRHMARLIPQAHLAIIPNAHHLLNLDNPEAFNQVVLDFLCVT